MKNNYNDIIDILMTLLNDEEIASSIVVSGTIVPFLFTKKEARKKIKKLYLQTNVYFCIIKMQQKGNVYV